ncbi:hypothetical protein K1T71_009514 [Dendrolimus kikuchii]|uniref:Uncharacterized protein n=1 Tax=Dendrolimus kikuchii TaxID=765133 RepID=A0ACC1CRX2_9NEOP|nr:hypothetical protein K1T71_009514 [Dendrolimus kikuchii]
MESHLNNIKITKSVQTCKSSNTSWTPVLRQTLVASGAWTCYFNLGLCVGTPTVMLPQLRSEANSTEAISENLASWIPAIFLYAGLPWVIILPIILHYFGRKKTYIFVTAASLINFVIYYLSTNMTMFFISEIFQGPNSASHLTTAVIIVTEYSLPKYRGIFLTLKSATFFWGMWVANAIGTFFHWKIIGLVGIACSVYGLMIVIFWPESPYWLAANGKFEKCTEAYKWLNGNDEESEKDLQNMINFQKELAKTRKSTLHAKEYIGNLYKTIMSKVFFKPILLAALTICLYSFSGKIIISVYAVEVLSQITNKSAVYSGMLILDGVTVLSMYIGSIIAKFVRRRTFLITSSFFAILFLFSLSLYLYLIKSSVIIENKYLSIALLMGFSISICCGPMILSSTIAGELISIESRSLSVCVIALFFKLLIGTLVKVSPQIFKSFSMPGAFLFFAVTCSFFLILIYKFLPETKDKTLHDIAVTIRGAKQSSDRLLQINTHMAYTIIRYCLFVPKFTYTLRCCQLWKQTSLLQTLDNIVRDTLISIINLEMDDRAWSQCSLPVNWTVVTSTPIIL